MYSDKLWNAFFLVLENGPSNLKLAKESLLPGASAVSLNTSTEWRPFLRQYVREKLEHDPEALTNLGVFEALGETKHNRLLNRRSFQEHERLVQFATTYEQRAQQMCKQHPPKDPVEQAHFDTLMHELNVMKQRNGPFLWHWFCLNTMDGLIPHLIGLFTAQQPLKTKEDAENYVSRMQLIPEQLAWGCELCQRQAAKAEQENRPELLTAQPLIDQTLKMVGEFLAADTDLFVAHLQENGPSEDAAAVCVAQARQLAQGPLKQAYQLVQRTLQQLPSRPAFGSSPSFYSMCLLDHTTTALTAAEIHELGVREVREIEQKMDRLLDNEKAPGSGSLSPGQRLSKLKKDREQDLCYPNTDQGKEQLRLGYLNIIDRCTRELCDRLFSLRPKAKCEVKRVPRENEHAAPAAYYYAPDCVGERKGIFYFNSRDTLELPRYGMETLTVHEAVPGHHYQLSVQMESEKLPALIKISDNNAYAEGWALYCERLAMEQGFYSDDLCKLGHYQDEILRAARLVVDTGLHVMGWTREQSIAYMCEKTGFDRQSMETEVDRYAAMPGQACGYKIGQLSLLRLRDSLQQQQQQSFDLVQFHDIILELGPLPLHAMETCVKAHFEQAVNVVEQKSKKQKQN